MLDPAIQTYLSERKVTWLKDKLKISKTEAEQQDIERAAEDKFDLANWLPDAAKRAGQLAMVTHPGKFSHPGAKTSSVIANAERKADGYLRTGNVSAEFDVFGNAAALDVHKFLSLTLSDGQTVLTHLEQDTPLIKQQFDMPSPYQELRQGLLSIKSADTAKAKTSEKIKQVYFPVDDGYHLLSLLTPSGLMFKLKERINMQRFSEAAKQARNDRRNQVHHEQGFDELYNLTVIGFGGTKPQNISVLNNQNGGTAYLLASLPPALELRATQAPKTNFFLQSLYLKDYQDKFKALHKLFGDTVPNNIDVREGRDYWILQIVEQVMEKVWAIRELPGAWSETSVLSPAQKIWLDAANSEKRDSEDDWLDEIIVAVVSWLGIAYKKAVGDAKAIPIGDPESRAFRQLLTEHREVLR
ncbi:MAG: type I-F CRISPR-associated protein Csy1 [Methylomonas sp.]|nr:type I-F CRISPR-associated protein Csy1 [Methylomonas sp.]